uniref:Fibrinogen C-terminal domain-containing protein n=1 Tax=Caenorhabditis tropicalis TaxID=1561998 RepID=A0A1I7UNE4_9PELO
MLKTSVLLTFLAVTVCAQQNYFKVLIREIDNPAGTLRNGNPCSEFGFLGVGCNTFLGAAVSASGNNVSNSNTLGQTQINTHLETRISNLNVIVSDDQASTADSFNGFDLHIALATDSNFTPESIIDDYVIHVSTDQEQGVYTYTNTRPGTLATTISIAWSTNIAPQSTTNTPEPTTTGVPFTGSTLPPTTTPKPPVDCSEISNLTSGIQTIYPDGSTPVSVYCDQTAYGAYTIIQSRGTVGENITFDLPYANYSAAFGTPGKGNNYWFGLDNMNSISGQKTYALQIDLCCGTKLIAKQIYHNFKVGNLASFYKLTASADISGTGLDYSSSGKDLAASFSTFADYHGPKTKDNCDQFEFYDDANDIQAKSYGGWWYGSCGNNLNGFLYPSRTLNCTVPLEVFDNNRMLGVNMRTTSGPGFDGYDVDLQSYDRVRMALFSFDSTTIDRKDDSFCQ